MASWLLVANLRRNLQRNGPIHCAIFKSTRAISIDEVKELAVAPNQAQAPPLEIFFWTILIGIHGLISFLDPIYNQAYHPSCARGGMASDKRHVSRPSSPPIGRPRKSLASRSRTCAKPGALQPDPGLCQEIHSQQSKAPRWHPLMSSRKIPVSLSFARVRPLDGSVSLVSARMGLCIDQAWRQE